MIKEYETEEELSGWAPMILTAPTERLSTMSQNRSTKTVSITLPIEVDAEIRAMAKEGRRSFSNQVALMLENQLDIIVINAQAQLALAKEQPKP
jgi:hypothetical protein